MNNLLLEDVSGMRMFGVLPPAQVLKMPLLADARLLLQREVSNIQMYVYAQVRGKDATNVDIHVCVQF